ncbi:hypothetical protein PY793_06865 [Acetobacter fabarum]|uniref:hypothetical protein n=1 Tax=Acetobacter fabarum TaxID=483199 RepID=UPI00312B7A21
MTTAGNATHRLAGRLFLNRHQSLRRYEPDQVPRQNLMLLAAGSPRCPAMDAEQKVASQFLGPEPPLVMCKQIA